MDRGRRGGLWFVMGIWVWLRRNGCLACFLKRSMECCKGNKGVKRGEKTCSPGYTESASRGQHTLMTLDTPRWRGGKKKRSRLVHYEQLFLSQLLEEKEFRD